MPREYSFISGSNTVFNFLFGKDFIIWCINLVKDFVLLVISQVVPICLIKTLFLTFWYINLKYLQKM